jgi:hypothetical protein
MVKKSVNILAFFFSLFILLGLLSFAPSLSFFSIQTAFLIENDSELYLNGSSNVNKFTCHCEQDFQRQPFEAGIYDQGRKLRFNSTFLNIQSEKLDCQNRRMNNDMHKTLKAKEHPFIKIQLLEAYPKNRQSISGLYDWTPFQAKAIITIADVKKQVALDVQGRRVDNNRFQFVSAKALYMSDFQLNPPSPLMGLIKVNDKIEINFDLIVRVMDV